MEREIIEQEKPMITEIRNAIHKGTSAVRNVYAKQVAEADRRAANRLSNARTKLELEHAKLALLKEKNQLRRDLMEAEQAIKREQSAIRREISKMGVQGAVRRTAKSVSKSVKKSRKSGLLKDFERAGRNLLTAPPKIRKKKSTRKEKGEWWERGNVCDSGERCYFNGKRAGGLANGWNCG
jgi:F0F1-type ATP synthase membrane subunit b/b'